jgi:hypothetical protein
MQIGERKLRRQREERVKHRKRIVKQIRPEQKGCNEFQVELEAGA